MRGGIVLDRSSILKLLFCFFGGFGVGFRFGFGFGFGAIFSPDVVSFAALMVFRLVDLQKRLLLF
jgi:hypothetical protein